MTIWEDAPLPKLPDLYSGIFIREGGADAAYERMADEIAATVIFGKLASKSELLATATAARLTVRLI